MSTSSIKTVPTLKGVFSMPKMNHRRDFLRENKLNLRELQRVTSKKQSNQQQELHQKQKYQQQQHQQQQTLYTNRRSASQQRVVPTRNAPRSISQQRSNSHLHLNLGCSSCNGGQGSCSTAISVASKAESYDKEIQTDDINDEEFLYEALKKCNTSEFNCASSRKSQIIPVRKYQSTQDLPEQHSKNQEINTENYKSNNCESQDIGSENKHRNYNCQISANENYNSLDNTANPEHSYRLNENNHLMEAINLNVGNLVIGNQPEQQAGTPLSGGSRHTINSTHSQDAFSVKKKGSSSILKFGSRDDIRLPRYLKREKQEKEEQRIREMVRDPNCPFGHFALTDEERYSALATAEKKFKSLVNELNRMPMTTETLRIRTRKAEIEKELVVLETDIRIFSKPKVYVKHQRHE